MKDEWQKTMSEFNGRWDKCFGCGQQNPIGLKLKFNWNGKEAVAEFTPRDEFQGWPGILHGGIIANIVDEAASWAFNYHGMFVITAKLEVTFRHPARIGEPLLITSTIKSNNGKRGQAYTRIVNKDGVLIAEGESLHVNIKNGNRLPENVIFGAIWDMDGVIVDSAEQHFESWREAFKKAGVEFSYEEFKQRFGQRNDAIIRAILKREVTASEIARIATDKEVYFRQSASNGIKAMPGAVELIKALKESGVKMAIASSAPPENISLILNKLGITNCFDAIVSGGEVSESKPSPQIFLKAAEKLGLEPSRCIVFEDAVAGVTAAKRAGMRCVALTSTNSRDALSGADQIVDSLAELSVSSLKQILQNQIN
ncbi:MAG: beta-phosphoglucomutase family hydrolase [Candidatus Sumerlaeia bacterium]|nr:beta-phosphoglucomutase family hydrolase [Candidatus Sumerlaeia bacterium]